MKRVIATTLLLAALPLLAQEATPPSPPPAAETPIQAQQRRESFPNLNVYLPEGEFDLRVRKLIRNVLFESQISYNFVDGDVSTFLRYKYYARDFTYKVGVFDEIGFDSIESRSGDFDRVRGGLLLFELPRNYNQRYFFLTQVDGLTYGRARPDNNSNNVYMKLGYQQGTPFDERLNAIVGESRGRIAPVLTAYRDIGPQKIGFAAAMTQALSGIGGDYDYTKFEAEGLKRSDITENSFVISRMHVGSFLAKQEREEPITDPEYEDDPSFQYDIPRYELFKVGGRDAMKAVHDRFRGTDEVHLTNELFIPIFRNRDIRKLGANFNNLYAIGYGGVGAIAYDTGDLFSDVIADAGVGFETSFTVRNFEVFLNAIYAHTLAAPEGMEGDEVRVSARTSR